MSTKNQLTFSHLRLRKIIGILGMSLPFILWLLHREILSSISHYYYTKTAVFFIGIVSVFGILLISYHRNTDDHNQIDWDWWITTIAGVAALIVIIIPTFCEEPNSSLCCETNTFPLYGHNNSFKNKIHLIAAGIFLFMLGLMSWVRFGNSLNTRFFKNIHKIMGLLIFTCLLVLVIKSTLPDDQQLLNFKNDIDIYFFETIALLCFGISWLIMGEAQSDFYNFSNACVKSIKKIMK